MNWVPDLYRHSRHVAWVLVIGGLASCERAKPEAQVPAEQVVTVRARDFAFDAPAEISAGRVTFKLVNEGPDLHHVQLIRFTDGKSLADLQQALKTPGPFPSWAKEAGGPNAVDPGHEGTATLDLEPGEYAIVCFVDTPDHVPHMMKGMTHALRVVPAAQGAPASPQAPADLVITMSSYAFDFSDSIRAGRRSIDVVVTGDQPHEMAIIRLAPDKTIDDLMKWGATYEGPLPGEALGGVSGTLAGTRQRIAVDFTPGNYVLLCFVPDAMDGKPHLLHGMMRSLTVL